MPTSVKYRPSIMIAAAIAMLAVPAAATTTIKSSAYGLSVDLRVGNLLNAGIAPVDPISGTALPAYASSAQVLSLSQSLGLGTVLGAIPALNVVFGQGISTGLITTSASSAYPLAPTGAASATVDNLGLKLTSKIGALPALTLLGIGARVVGSTSSVEGYGTPSAAGATTIAGLTLTGSVLGTLTIDGSLFSSPDPNTVLLNLIGIEITLNEQVRTGNALTDAGITTNAIHARFTNYILGSGLLNGDIIVSNSGAAIKTGIDSSNVPEPAVWLEMIAGFGFVGTASRLRRAPTA